MRFGRAVGSGVAIGAAACILAGCGLDTVESDQSMLHPMDRTYAGDARFYAALQPGPGFVAVRPAESLDRAEAESTVAVLAEVKDVIPLDFYPDDSGPADEPAGRGVQTMGIVLRPVEVLSGALRPELADVTVEFLAGPLPFGPDQKSQLAPLLPKGQSIWFLRWQGQRRAGVPASVPINDRGLGRYALVSFESVFTQGLDGAVRAPIAAYENMGSHDGDVVAEAAGFQRMTELAEAIRQPS